MDKDDEYPLLTKPDVTAASIAATKNVEKVAAATAAAAERLTETVSDDTDHAAVDEDGSMSEGEDEDADVPTATKEDEHKATSSSAASTTAAAAAAENHLPCRWSTGTGPRIRCVRDYPQDLQSRALEHVNLSPRLAAAGWRRRRGRGPVPSPRPSPDDTVAAAGLRGLPAAGGGAHAAGLQEEQIAVTLKRNFLVNFF